MSSVEVLLINALLYTFTLIYVCMKYKLSVGVFVWSLYTISAWSSFLFIQQPGYSSSVHASEQTILPCFYLYFILVVSMTPLMKLNKIENIDFFNKRLLKAIIFVATIIQIVFVIVDIPAVIKVITSGSFMLNELRSTVYGNEGISLLTKNPWLNRVTLLFSGMRVLSTGLSVITFIAYKDNRRLINLFALSALLNNIRMIIVQVGRGEMVFVFLIYVCTIYLMRDWLSDKKKRAIVFYAVPIVIVGAIFFWAITVSRFDKKAAFFMYKYLGEPINNFNGILFRNIEGTTNGRAYFSLFYQYLLGETGVITADDKWNLILKMTSIRGDIFYTWVGGLIIEFGKIVPLFVAIALNRVLDKLASIKKYYIGDIIVLIFFMNFYIRGIFIFPIQSFEGTLMILYTLLLYLLFRIRKNKEGNPVYIIPKPKSRDIKLN